MYNVSNGYLSAIRNNVVTDRLSGTVTLTDGTVIDITDDIIMKNSVKLTKELCGDKYRIGTFNLACLKITYIDDYALGRNYSDAKIVLNYELLTDEENDVWESVPLGIFIVDGTLVRRKRDKITLTAYDYGVYFDNEPSDAVRSMSGTPEEVITAICSERGITFAGFSDTFPNTDITITPSGAQLQSNRDIIMWIAALLCSYATIDRTGALRIIRPRYAQEDTTIEIDRHLYSDERDSIYVTDTRAYIKYMSAYSGGDVKQYVSNFDAEDKQAAPAAYSLSKNPLLSGKTATECDTINEDWLEYIDNFMQRGIEAKIYGDPAIDVGDTIRCHEDDVDQRASIVGVITRYEWNYRNYAYIHCSAPQCASVSGETGTTGGSSDIKSQTDKRIDAAGSSAGGGTSYNNCVIIADKDSDYFLHTYTQVDYIAGNRIGYGGASNKIIVGGYGVVKNGLDDEAPVYGTATFSRGDESGTYGTNLTFYSRLAEVLNGGAQFEIRTKSSNLSDGVRYTVFSSSMDCGFIFTWTNIYPPEERYPYGWVLGYWRTVYYDSGNKHLYNGRQVCLGFSSQAEYNAAVGLTYEPITLTTVNETITQA